MSNRTIAIVQARMGSTRFPGKVLTPVLGVPLLEHLVERVRRAATLDGVMVATSEEAADDAIADYCTRRDYQLFRGSADDVLDRYYRAAAVAEAETIVRLTADCPLLDPDVIDTVVRAFHDGGYDYAANTAPPPSTFPDGMDVEVFSRHSLDRAWRDAKEPSHREHVTFYFWQNPELFRTMQLDHDPDWSACRLTVDYPEDLKLVCAVLEALGPSNPAFMMDDIIEYLEMNPETKRLNQHIPGNQGWKSALRKDRESGY